MENGSCGAVDDGYVRAATIRYNGGRTNRPISKPYPLEVSSVDTNIKEVDWNTIDDKGDGRLDAVDHMKTVNKEFCY